MPFKRHCMANSTLYYVTQGTTVSGSRAVFTHEEDALQFNHLQLSDRGAMVPLPYSGVFDGTAPLTGLAPVLDAEHKVVGLKNPEGRERQIPLDPFVSQSRKGYIQFHIDVIDGIPEMPKRCFWMGECPKVLRAEQPTQIEANGRNAHRIHLFAKDEAEALRMAHEKLAERRILPTDK